MKKPPGDDLFSHTSQCSIVSATTFHFRVRDGNGWFHRALITKGLLRYVFRRFENKLVAGAGFEPATFGL